MPLERPRKAVDDGTKSIYIKYEPNIMVTALTHLISCAR
jgi:hypothetical protein